jgi:glycerophosphoryl diester phosphodiesterase
MTTVEWITRNPIAHRGYHDMNNKVWENTLPAFERAAEAGFTIECDLQLSADGEVLIFHDDGLQRLCGIKGDITRMLRITASSAFHRPTRSHP